jgi:hypothetical protein
MKPNTLLFNMSSWNYLPDVRIRGISAVVDSWELAPRWWDTPIEQEISSQEHSFVASIDPSNPFLELPWDVCENFAKSLNLVFNDTMSLYTFKDQHHLTWFLSQPSVYLTFRLASFDNYRFMPFAYFPPEKHALHGTSDEISIQVSSRALVQWYTDSPFSPSNPFPYFAIKQHEWKSFSAVAPFHLNLGRAFMQEAYLIVNYETQSFSLHQALFPDNAVTNVSLVEIPSEHDRFGIITPRYMTDDGSRRGIQRRGLNNPGVIAGIVIGSVAGFILLLIVAFLVVRYIYTRPRHVEDASASEDGPAVTNEKYGSTKDRRVGWRAFFKFGGFRRRNPSDKTEVNGSSSSDIEAPMMEENRRDISASVLSPTIVRPPSRVVRESSPSSQASERPAESVHRGSAAPSSTVPSSMSRDSIFEEPDASSSAADTRPSSSESSSIMTLNLETQRRHAVDTIMFEFKSILRFGPHIGVSIRAGGRESGSSIGEPIRQTISKRSSGSSNISEGSGKRSREWDRGKDLVDADKRGEVAKRSKSGEVAEKENCGLLACPYYKRNPKKHQKLRSCAGPGWSTVHRVK